MKACLPDEVGQSDSVYSGSEKVRFGRRKAADSPVVDAWAISRRSTAARSSGPSLARRRRCRYHYLRVCECAFKVYALQLYHRFVLIACVEIMFAIKSRNKID